MATSLVSQHGPNPQSGTPDRSVSLPVPSPREIAATMLGGDGQLQDDARNPESESDAELLAQLMEGLEEGWLSPSQKQSLRTAGEVVRPLQLRDLGLSGMAGMIPLPLPGGAAGRGVARGVSKGIRSTDDLMRAALNFLRGGGDVVDEVADLGRVGRRSQNTVARPGSPAQELFPPHVEGLAAMGRGGRTPFQRDALRGRIRGSSAQNPGAAHLSSDDALFETLSGMENHVGMGRLSNYSEADIKHWYLLDEARSRGVSGVSSSFDGMTGVRIPGAVEKNRAVLAGLSDEVVEAAEAAYERDAAAYLKMTGFG